VVVRSSWKPGAECTYNENLPSSPLCENTRRSGHQSITQSNVRAEGATDERKRIDQRERETKPGAYAEEGVPEEVERHARADEEEEGDLGGPRGGRRRGGREDAQEGLGAEQRREEEQEGQGRGEAEAEAGPRAAAGRRERRHRRRPFHRHRRAAGAAAAGRWWSPGLQLGGLRGI